MRISVLIPAYNAAAFIAEAIASVHAQTLAVDEILVVDDGSVDATATIAEQAGAIVIRCANQGVSAARNTGIARARGEWIAMLDADDRWMPDKLARQFAALQSAPEIDVASCDHYQVGADGAVRLASALQARRDRYERIERSALPSGDTRLHGMGIGLIRLGMLLFPSTLVARKAAIVRAGGFRKEFRRVEDYEFLMRLLAHSDVAFVEAPLMAYRIHPQSLSQDAEGMAQGIVDLGDALRKDAPRYADGAAAAFDFRLRQALMELAVRALRRGNGVAARRFLTAAARIGRDRRWWMMRIASRVPRALLVRLMARRTPPPVAIEP